MSRPIQLYQDELGLALARELQRNQERSRRGSSPLQPTVQNAASQAQSAATTAAASDATSKANAAQTAANAYTNQQIAALQQQIAQIGGVPSGGQIMWQPADPIPSGWSDTGRTVALDAGNVRKVIRKN